MQYTEFGSGLKKGIELLCLGYQNKNIFHILTVELKGNKMKSYSAIIEKDQDTGLYVGYIPGFPGAHSQAETLEELRLNLSEVVEMLLEEA